MSKKAIIIGAGPAGLTAAYELLKRTDITPIVLEKSGYIGGISRTINYKGNRMDMGPHRFFSKSDRVMDWWLKMMPLETADKEVKISYQNKSRDVRDVRTEDVGMMEDTVKSEGAGKFQVAAVLRDAAILEDTVVLESEDTVKPDYAARTDEATTHVIKDPDKVMLVIQRLTRIYFLRKFFAYPIQLSIDTLRTLGLIRTVKIMFSFLWIRLFPRKPEKSLEDFIINKFGRQLYLLFFKDYTEKVWGVPCHEISAEWGAQRIKGVSLSKAVLEALKTMRNKKKGKADLGQKGTETSLIEQFLYPKRGPGSLWEEVARQVQEMGGKIFLNQDVVSIQHENNSISLVHTVNSQTGQTGAWEGDYFFSTMPVQELIAGMEGPVPVPPEVREVAAGLQYRDFINVGILLRQLSAPGKDGAYEKLELKDNWIYIQERDVKVGRLMIYNNWGGGMIKDPNTTWIGMEYFCNKTDDFWSFSDELIQKLAIQELVKMNLAQVDDVLDCTVARMEKTYPAYFGTYDRFGEIRDYVSQFENLFLVGRNGMHKYNNADHSMLCAMVAVDNIMAGVTAKANLWEINTEQEYHEEKAKIEKIISVPDNTHQEVHQFVLNESKTPFVEFILKESKNKKYLWISVIGVIILFIIFKLLYPFADYSNDSYTYINVAAANDNVSLRPIGYSKFLRAFSALSTSDVALVSFQYLLIEIGALYFFYTILYFFKPRKIVTLIIFVFAVFNPVSLYISNYVGSDAMFIGLSLLWMTHLLWIINRPRRYDIFMQALLLIIILTIRYNALYYPLITALSFSLARKRIGFKIGGVISGFLVIGIFVWLVRNETYEKTGTRIFSGFSGWQMASNAIYLYHHVDINNRDLPSLECRKFNSIVERYFDTLKSKELPPLTSTYFLWDDHAPLKKYWFSYIKDHRIVDSMSAWHAVGLVFSEYSFYLIKNYPFSFAKYYLWPNTKEYVLAKLEVLRQYNLGLDSVKGEAKYWFQYSSGKVRSSSKTIQVKFLSFFPLLFGINNFLLLVGLPWFFISNIKREKLKVFNRSLLLIGFFMLVNFCFSVFAAPIVFRYEFFPMLISVGFFLLILDEVIKVKRYLR